jgi:hypothetical protein
MYRNEKQKRTAFKTGAGIKALAGPKIAVLYLK